MSEVKAEIGKANARFGEAFRKGSAAEVAASYTEGAMILPPNRGIVEGADAIKGFWQAVIDMGIKDLKLESVEVQAQGDTAVEVGSYALFVEGGVEADHGKYVVIWKNEKGAWKLHRDIWNTSQPAK